MITINKIKIISLIRFITHMFNSFWFCFSCYPIFFFLLGMFKYIIFTRIDFTSNVCSSINKYDSFTRKKPYNSIFIRLLSVVFLESFFINSLKSFSSIIFSLLFSIGVSEKKTVLRYMPPRLITWATHL